MSSKTRLEQRPTNTDAFDRILLAAINDTLRNCFGEGASAIEGEIVRQLCRKLDLKPKTDERCTLQDIVLRMKTRVVEDRGKLALGLEDRLKEALGDHIRGLSVDFQRILVDDLITAFLNRMSVLLRVQGRFDASKTRVQYAKQTDLERRIEKARILMATLEPVRLRLKAGAQLKLDDEIVIRKEKKGRIVLYEVK